MENTPPSSNGRPLTIGEIFLKQKLINREQLNHARKKATKQHRSVEDILREEGLVTDALLVEAIAALCSIPTHKESAKGKMSLSTLFTGETNKTTALGKLLWRWKQYQCRTNELRMARREENRRLRKEHAKMHMTKKTNLRTGDNLTKSADSLKGFQLVRLGSKWEKPTKNVIEKMRIQWKKYQKQKKEERRIRTESNNKKEKERLMKSIEEKKNRELQQEEKEKERKMIALKKQKQRDEQHQKRQEAQQRKEEREKLLFEEQERIKNENRTKKQVEALQKAEEQKKAKKEKRARKEKERIKRMEERDRIKEEVRQRNSAKRQERIAAKKHKAEERYLLREAAHQKKMQLKQKRISEKKRKAEERQRIREEVRQKKIVEKQERIAIKKRKAEEARIQKEMLHKKQKEEKERKRVEKIQKIKMVKEAKEATKKQIALEKEIQAKEQKRAAQEKRLAKEKVILEKKEAIKRAKEEKIITREAKYKIREENVARKIAEKKAAKEPKKESLEEERKRIEIEAKNEAMKQILIEQEKQKLAHEQGVTKQQEQQITSNTQPAVQQSGNEKSTMKLPSDAEQSILEEQMQRLKNENERLIKELEIKKQEYNSLSSINTSSATKEKENNAKEAIKAKKVIDDRKKQYEEELGKMKQELEKGKNELAEAKKELEQEKTACETERKKCEIDRNEYKAKIEDSSITCATLSVAEMQKIRKKTEEEIAARCNIQKDEILSGIEKTKQKIDEAGEDLSALDRLKKELIHEKAALESQKSAIREDVIREANAKFERERTQWEIDKERIQQQAIANAQLQVISQSKGKGIFGRKQQTALQEEIDKWKTEAAKLEKQQAELEQNRVLQEEKERMRAQQQKIEEEKVRLERESIARERMALAQGIDHNKKIESAKEQLTKERQDLEEEKKEEKHKKEESKDSKKTEKKSKKSFLPFMGKKGKSEFSIEMPDTPPIDIGNILLAQNYIEQTELDIAKKTAEERNVSVDHILKEEGLVTKALIQNAIAEYYKMSFVDLSSQPPETDVLEMLPEEFSTTLHAIAIAKNENGALVVATSTPEHGEFIKKTVMDIVPEVGEVIMAYTSKDAIENAFSFYRKPLDTRFRAIIEEHKKIAPEIIEEIFADAIQLGASDIHFEPQEQRVIVRFRVDGVMHEAGRLPKEYYEGIVNRIKIAGNMRIDEHFAAQDGAIRWKGGGKTMDVRVSIVPIVDGEKIVMRLLSEYVRTLTLSDLGFSPRQLDILVKKAHKPFGMVLTTGPTGSGKSTTLYGLMKLRNSPDVNISTIEDPVEYKIAGINHIQVNVKANLTFERGLRALVRQDPDIILVGEIRDDITAQISVNAALTGHLLFSTLHANDAATAVPRLLEMSIEPYLLASTLELIIAQRLMRRTCTNCRYSTNISHSEACQLFPNAEHYFTDEGVVTMYKGKGCKACGGTGFKGRVGIYELLVVSPEVQDLIVQRRTSGEINSMARSQGMLTLFEDGLEKVRSGLSTIEELMRIASPPDIISAPVANASTILKEEN